MRQEKSDPSLYRKTPPSFARNLMDYVTFINDNDMTVYISEKRAKAPKRAAYTPRFKYI
jgi:hypothetical protein